MDDRFLADADFNHASSGAAGARSRQWTSSPLMKPSLRECLIRMFSYWQPTRNESWSRMIIKPCQTFRDIPDNWRSSPGAFLVSQYTPIGE